MTQTEMTIAAGAAMHGAEVRLRWAESAESKNSATAGNLAQLQLAESTGFRSYAQSVVDFAGGAYKGGSLEPTVRASTMSTLLDQRSARVESRNVEGVVAAGSTAGAGLQTQGAMNRDSGLTLQDAEASLAAVTDRIRLRLADSPRAASFEQTVQTFAAYADAVSATAGARVEGGSLEPLARAGARESLVRERVALLDKTLADLSL